MVIYYAMTKYHLLFSITHMILTNKAEEAYLFLYDGLQGGVKNIDRLKEKKICKDIFLVPEIKFREGWKSLNENSSITDIDYNINLISGRVEKWLPINIRLCKEIYIANDQWSIGLYCIMNRIPYIYYEDGVGMLSQPDYSYELVKKMSITHAIMAKRIGAFGQNNVVTRKMADLNNQQKGFYDKLAIHFSLRNELKKLNANQINDLLYIFDAKKYGNNRSGTLLLTEHFVNMRRISVEEQKELYTLLVDFFFVGEELYIKPHPNDLHINYEKLFLKNVNMISRLFPSELLPFCYEGNIKLALAACSTSVYGLQERADKIIRFNSDIETYYQQLIKYYFVKRICERLKEYEINGINVHMDFFEALEVKNKSRSNKRINIVGNVQKYLSDNSEISKNNLTIFINEENSYSLYIDENFLKMKKVLIRISKELQSKTNLINCKDEYIWVTSKNEMELNKIKNFKEVKVMENLGVILEAETILNDETIRIKMLEGKLLAALDQVSKYQTIISDLKEENHKLKDKISNYDKEIINRLEKSLSNEPIVK